MFQVRIDKMGVLSYVSIAAASLALYFIITRIVTSVQGYRFAKAKGCKEPIKFPQSERILGYARFKQQIAEHKAKIILPSAVQRFRDVGNTYSAVALGQKVIITIEPENIKALLATNFNDFGLGTRFDAMGALLGHGIFTSDGALWEHSRVREISASSPIPLLIRSRLLSAPASTRGKLRN